MGVGSSKMPLGIWETWKCSIPGSFACSFFPPLSWPGNCFIILTPSWPPLPPPDMVLLTSGCTIVQPFSSLSIEPFLLCPLHCCSPDYSANSDWLGFQRISEGRVGGWIAWNFSPCQIYKWLLIHSFNRHTGHWLCARYTASALKVITVLDVHGRGNRAQYDKQWNTTE